MKKKLSTVFLFFGLLLSATTNAQINAVDDTFGVIYGATDVVAGNVLSNDLLNNLSVVPAEITLTQLTASHPGISLSGPNVVVAGGTPKGSYTLTYKICSVANSTLCDIATVTINTKLLANPDNFNAYCFNSYLGNVLGSGTDLNFVDTLNGTPAILQTYYTQPGNVEHPADVGVNLIAPYPGIEINSNGDVFMLQPLPFGDFVVVYELYELAHPTNTSISYINISVLPPLLYASDDYFPAVDNAFQNVAGNVLENDFMDCIGTLNGSATVVANTPAGITMLPDGTIVVDAGTTPGNYVINYLVCENIYNMCAPANAYITVIGPSNIIANYDDFSTPNYPGTSTPSVLNNDTLNGNPVSTPFVSLTALNLPTGFTLNTSTGTITIAPTVVEGTYTVPYKICDGTNPNDCYVNYAYVVVLKNRILGKIRFDENANGCDAGDAYLLDISVKNVNGSITYSSATKAYNDNAYYLIGDSGTNTVSVTNLPPYFTITPPTQVFNFSTPGTTIAPDFCISANSSVDDLEVVLIPLFNVVPGLPAFYNVWFKNNGSTTLSGQITLQFDNTKMSFLSSSPSPFSNSTGSLVYNFTALHPFESRTISNVKWQINTPPTVDAGQVVAFTGSIAPVASDYTPLNNTNTVTQTVVNSQDPNDIIVHEGASVTLAKAQQEYLHYTIRFQNIGTSDAINIKVLNDLDPKLDWSTFQLISTSHPCRIKNTNNHNEFLFENINLPGTSNEPLSHGYISFKVKAVSAIAVGDVIPNQAEIYFDYNAPIATNIVNTTIISNLGVDTFENGSLEYYPNPTSGLVTFSLKNARIDQLEITDVLGKTLMSKMVQDQQTSIDLSGFNSGIYFAKLTCGTQEKTIKIVKE